MNRFIAFTVLVLSLAAVASATAGDGNDAQAFDRASRETDRLPDSYHVVVPPRGGHVTIIRRVATYNGGPNRSARLYIYKTSHGMTCYMLIRRGGSGGGCNPSPLFAGTRVVAGAGQFLSGVAANEVTRIVVIGSQGVRHRVPLSADNGFIYDCRTYNGCTCSVAWLDAYAGDKRVHHQNWLGNGCSRKRR